MKTPKVVIKKTKDAENVDGVYGGGDTPEEAKHSILTAIELLKNYNDSKIFLLF